MSRKAVEILEFRSALVVLGLLAGLLVYFSLFAGHRPPHGDDARPLPNVPAGAQPPPSSRL